jgi:hypothetical protein
VYDAILAEERNKPAVVLVNRNFLADSKSAGSSQGVPVRTIPETIPSECTEIEKIKSGVDAVTDPIIDALTRPLSADEEHPPVKEAEKSPRIAFKGSLKEINRFFYKRGWTDGFPIIPPTEDEVTEMLTGTDLPADHIVAQIIPRLGKATVEKIAVNAVMAGALPTYMPILIAGVQALLDPEVMFGTTEVSTASWVPFWIINGPIRQHLHLNSGFGVFSPGDIANASIGRAMGLIIKNIGGARKGVEDMGRYGNPGKYTLVCGENEEQSPWQPLHMQHGLQKEDNAVTLTFPISFHQANRFGSDANGLMRGLMASVQNKYLTIIMNPDSAKTFSESGWTKKEIAEFLYQYARIPAEHSMEYWGQWLQTWQNSPKSGEHNQKKVEQWTSEKIRPPLNASDPVPVLRSPEAVRIVIAGGEGGGILLLGSGIVGTGWATRKMELPANWDSLVKKYQDIVPTYVRY